MDVRSLSSEFQALAADQKFVCHEYGNVNGHPLRAFTRQIPDKPRIYFSSGIHGDEPAGVLALLQLLRDGFFDSRASWFICPLLNPTGLERGTRENADGIDLNREYRHPKTAEIRSHRAWIESQPPQHAALSLHEDWETTGFYLYEINTSTRPCIGPAVLEAVKHGMEIETKNILDGHPVSAPGYIYHPPESDERETWPEAIFHVKHCAVLSCTFETPSSQPLEQRVDAHITAVKAGVEEFIKNFVPREGLEPSTN
ncbi:MAG: M14 family metallocarboxypeptidase [Methylacidiphilales bacterium]|nr:M14 family metallocarboxypeptidase [Candidatus Methylacidiphilales bacterium]